MAYNWLSHTIQGTPAIDHPVIIATSSGTLQTILSFHIWGRKDGNAEVFLHSLCLCGKRRAKPGLEESKKKSVDNHDLFGGN